MSELPPLPAHMDGESIYSGAEMRAYAEAYAAAKMAEERERCAKLCDVARDAIWPYHDPEVLNAACTVCENLANRIRGIGA